MNDILLEKERTKLSSVGAIPNEIAQKSVIPN